MTVSVEVDLMKEYKEKYQDMTFNELFESAKKTLTDFDVTILGRKEGRDKLDALHRQLYIFECVMTVLEYDKMEIPTEEKKELIKWTEDFKISNRRFKKGTDKLLKEIKK